MAFGPICIVCKIPVTENEIQECDKENLSGIYCHNHLTELIGHDNNIPINVRSAIREEIRNIIREDDINKSIDSN